VKEGRKVKEQVGKRQIGKGQKASWQICPLPTCLLPLALYSSQTGYPSNDFKYNSSTFFRAHGVFRKNFKLDWMLGSFLKQLTSM